MNRRRRRVVITGAGAMHVFGAGLGALGEGLARGVPLLTEVGGEAAGGRRPPRARLAARVPEAVFHRCLSPLAARRLSPPSRLAVAAAREAMENAALAPAMEPDGEMGVALGSCFGPSSFSQRICDQIQEEGPDAASPALFTECVASAAASQVSIHCRAAGPNLTLSQGTASPLLATSRAAGLVAAGRVPRMLSGGVEEMTPLVHALLDRCGALARSSAAGEEIPRPLDRRRNGFLAGEGATVLVLEDEAAAHRRGAGVLGRLRAWGSAFDPTAAASAWGNGGATLGRALLRDLQRWDLDPGQVDRIVAGASGASRGDAVEAAVLRAAWQDRPLPPILVPKGTMGEYGGGLLAAALLACTGQDMPAAGFGQPDPELGVVPHGGEPLPPARRLLLTTAAAGGGYAWLVLEAP